jgi:hypothetical protein
MATLPSRVFLIHICPGCHKSPLRSVEGGLGRMGQCHKCGYTGPLGRTGETDDDDRN